MPHATPRQLKSIKEGTTCSPSPALIVRADLVAGLLTFLVAALVWTLPTVNRYPDIGIEPAICILAGPIGVAFSSWARRRTVRIRRELARCERCGHDIAGVPACPECAHDNAYLASRSTSP